MLLCAPARESAAFVPTRLYPRKSSLCFYPLPPEIVLPLLLPAPTRIKAAFAPTRPCLRERSLCSYPPLPEDAQFLLSPAPARGSASFAPARPCPRKCSLCSYSPLPEGAQPLPFPPPARGRAAFAPVLSYSDILVIDKTICFCRRLLWVSFYVVSLLFLLFCYLTLLSFTLIHTVLFSKYKKNLQGFAKIVSTYTKLRFNFFYFPLLTSFSFQR